MVLAALASISAKGGAVGVDGAARELCCGVAGARPAPGRWWARGWGVWTGVGRERVQCAAHHCLQSLSVVGPAACLGRALQQRSSGGPGVPLTPSILRAVILIPSARPHRR